MTEHEKKMLPRATAVPIPVALLSGTAAAVSRYAPETETWTESCRHAVLAGVPGEVIGTSARAVGDTTLIKLFIAQQDGKNLAVACDGPSGKIVRTMAVDGQ